MSVSSWQTTENKNIITVDDSGGADYLTIQEALDASSDGDTIFVYNGLYEEHLAIKNNINLIGEEKENTIIQGFDRNISSIISVECETFSIEHISIKGLDTLNLRGIVINYDSRNSIINDTIISDCFVGIRISEPNNIISNNTFKDCWQGINVGSNFADVIIDNNLFLNSDLNLYSERCTITNNLFYDSGIRVVTFHLDNINIFFENNKVNDKPFVMYYKESDKTLTAQAGQIVLIDCENFVIKNQNMDSSYGSITLEKCNNCEIKENIINTSDTGIYVNFCNDITITDNEVNVVSSNLNSAVGIFVSNSDSVSITANNIDVSSSEIIFINAISISESNKILVQDNFIKETTTGHMHWGIDVYFSSNLTFKHNIFKNLEAGILLLSKNNLIEQNTFEGNNIGIYYLRVTDAIYDIGPFGGHIIKENNFIENNEAIRFLIFKFTSSEDEPYQELILNHLSDKSHLDKFRLYDKYDEGNQPSLDPNWYAKTTFENNYYDDHSSRFPKMINGNIYLELNLSFYTVPWIALEWFPAKNPNEW